MKLIEILRRALRLADSYPLDKYPNAVATQNVRPWRYGAPCVHYNQCGSLVAPMDAELRKKFRDALKPLPKRMYPGKLVTPKVRLVPQPVYGCEEYTVDAKGTIRRREPKNEFKARKRAEWKQKVHGMRLAAVAA